MGLALSEVAFSMRDHGAFPHLNVYTADPVLGVRLLPGESMRIAFGGNPVTSVRINKDGFRGLDLPAPGSDEVVVVGDSQVFGLGVEEGETTCARLEALLPGARVVNAGVPTYGPPEFERVLADLLEKRKPKRVVYVVNFANDLFEAERPNTERHAVWDGWAVRRETAPSHVASFPGRNLLFRKSHAIFALRRFWYRQGGPTEAFTVPSEGTFADIGLAAARAAEEHLRARDDTRRLAKLQNAKVSVANAELRGARDRFVELVGIERIGMETDTPGSIFGGRWDPVKASFAQPGDIVGTDDYGEYTGPLYATADLIVKGAEFRRKVEQRLRDRAAKNAADAARITPVLDAVEDAQKRADTVRAETVPRIRAWSPLAPSLRRIKALCDAAGARLVVAALPLDVQVSKDEWEKHGPKHVDLEPARILVDDLIDAAEDVGATAIDLTDTLRAAEPGAFLKRDIHLSPKGHEAVAKALAAVLSRPPSPKLAEPAAGRPLGRTLPTTLASARTRKEVNVPGSTAAGCETYIVDEWLTLRCHDGGIDKAVPTGVRVAATPLGESVIYRDSSRSGPPALVVQVPLIRGEDTAVDFRWPARSRRVQVGWGERINGVTINFRELESAADVAKIADPPKPSEAICAVVKEAGVAGACGEMPLFDNPACFETYRGDAKSIVACLRGERDAACGRGAAPVGVFQRCVPLCNKDVPCKQGTCSKYAGAEVCL
ncbi:Hypothetical protein A7982_04057 [Minicystis rosea]|nr:Hypothetical protein A7982_04057 [Minicystis rosea]